MSNYKIITSSKDVNRDRWDEFVSNHPNGNFFQTADALELFSDLPGYKPLLFMAMQDDVIKGILVAVMMSEAGLKGYFSRRCIIWGGPLCYDNNTSEQLIFELNKFTANKSIYTEFRNLFDTSSYSNSFQAQKFIYKNWLNYIVKIEGVDENKNKLNGSKKRQTLKSFKAGAIISQPQSIEDVKEMYNLLVELYKEKIKKPLPGIPFL